MSKKQTAVEYLQYTYFKTGMLYKSDFKKALEMERNQMGGAFISGGLNWETPLTFDEYLKKIYGGGK